MLKFFLILLCLGGVFAKDFCEKTQNKDLNSTQNFKRVKIPTH